MAMTMSDPPIDDARGDWYCPGCQRYLARSRVTLAQTCDDCGAPVQWHTVEEACAFEAAQVEVEKLRARVAELERDHSIAEAAREWVAISTRARRAADHAAAPGATEMARYESRVREAEEVKARTKLVAAIRAREQVPARTLLDVLDEATAAVEVWPEWKKRLCELRREAETYFRELHKGEGRDD